jgi:hypothetical protein
MVLKPINEYTSAEVGMWLTAQGLSDHVPKFLTAGVDGDVLVSLEIDDYTNELGLSMLQAKKVMSNIEFSLDMVLGGSMVNKGGGVGGGATVGGGTSGGGDAENERRLARQVRELQDEVRRKDEEISDLNRRLCDSMMIQHQQRQQQQQHQYAAPLPPPPQQQQQQQQYYDAYQQPPPSSTYPLAPQQTTYSNGDPYQYQITPLPPPAQQQQQQQQQQYQQQVPPSNPYQNAPPATAHQGPGKGAQVIGGAAKGAAGGAIKGAISEFIRPFFLLHPEHYRSEHRDVCIEKYRSHHSSSPT